uniref:Uncharacterized protein n=1 Tax=Anguilla anguilla TaxID=7936 RepID=A0A0E9W3M2_ANGAN
MVLQVLHCNFSSNTHLSPQNKMAVFNYPSRGEMPQTASAGSLRSADRILHPHHGWVINNDKSNMKLPRVCECVPHRLLRL